MNDDRRQAIPFDYDSYQSALDAVRTMIASARKFGYHKHADDLTEKLQAAQKALAEFDAGNVRAEG
jgi:hypothetical protein